MGCDGNGVGGAMELLKAFKSPFSSRVGKKNLLSTYSKILSQKAPVGLVLDLILLLKNIRIQDHIFIA